MNTNKQTKGATKHAISKLRFNI